MSTRQKLAVIGVALCLVAAFVVRFELVPRAKAAAEEEKTAATASEETKPADAPGPTGTSPPRAVPPLSVKLPAELVGGPVTFNSRTGSGYIGLGIECKVQQEGALLLVYVRTNSPAERKGLRPGDRILAINGQSLPAGISLARAASLLEGAPDSSIDLILDHGLGTRTWQVSLRREWIPIGDRAESSAASSERKLAGKNAEGKRVQASGPLTVTFGDLVVGEEGNVLSVIEVRGPAAEKKPASAAAARVPAYQLRYDGRSFDEWSSELWTELKPERKTEAIRALTEFGRHGYAKEATRAILQVMRDYDVRVTGGKSPKDKLKEAALAAFGGLDELTGERGRPIDPKESVPILVRELNEGNENSRFFAVYALSEIGPGARAAIPALLELWNSSKDPSTRYFAIRGVVHADPGGEHILPLLRKALTDKDVERFREVLRADTLGRLAGAILPLLVEAAGNKNRDIRYFAISSLGSRRGAAKNVLPVLINAFEKGDREDRMAVAQALYSLGAEAKDAVPVLIRALERSSDIFERSLIARALGNMGAAAKDALPLIEKTLSEVSDVHAAIKDQDRQWMLQELSKAASQVRAVLPDRGKSIAPPGPGKPAGAKGSASANPAPAAEAQPAAKD